MVRKATTPAVVALATAIVAGSAWGPGVAASAAVAIVVVYLNFAVHGVSLAWASTVSIAAVQAVALGGLVLRLATIVALLFVLRMFDWFSPTAFAVTLAPALMLLLAYEARLSIRGVGATLQIPADPAAIRAAQALAAREAR